MAALPVATVSTWTNPAPPAPPPGLVASGAPTVFAMNKPIARIGDTLTSHGNPMVNKMCQATGINIITTGVPTILVAGQPIAVATSACLCGHVLLPTNSTGVPMTVMVGGAVTGVTD